MRFERPPKKSGKSWRGPHLVFDYGANSVAVGSDIDAVDVADMKGQIQMASGKTIRRGDATKEELQDKWAPGALSKLQGVADSPSLSPALPADPVTLSSPSTLALIFANLVPLAGTVLLGWNLGDVMVLYWAETAVIGFFNICKIAIIGRWAALLAGPFFIVHFGGFMSVHFLFIYTIFVQGVQDSSGVNLNEVMQLFINLWPALAALFASHTFSFFHNFIGRGEFTGRTVNKQMTEPYSRIIFMHMVIIFGGGLSLVLGEPTPVLLIVIVLKIWFDVKAHLKQRVRQ